MINVICGLVRMLEMLRMLPTMLCAALAREATPSVPDAAASNQRSPRLKPPTLLFLST